MLLAEGRDAQNDETNIHFPPCCFKFEGSWPTVLGKPLATLKPGTFFNYH